MLMLYSMLSSIRGQVVRGFQSGRREFRTLHAMFRSEASEALPGVLRDTDARIFPGFAHHSRTALSLQGPIGPIIRYLIYCNINIIYIVHYVYI